MNKIIITISASLILVFLTACSEKTQSVEWYLEHPDILAKEFEKCKHKTPVELVKDKHCTVIRQAQDKAFDDHQRNAPIPKFEFK